jgi:hypothetical protein
MAAAHPARYPPGQTPAERVPVLRSYQVNTSDVERDRPASKQIPQTGHKLYYFAYFP